MEKLAERKRRTFRLPLTLIKDFRGSDRVCDCEKKLAMRGYRYRRATFDLGIKQTTTDRGWWAARGWLGGGGVPK